MSSVSEDGPHAEDQQDRLRNDPEEAAAAATEAEESATRADVDVTTDIRHGVPKNRSSTSRRRIRSI